MKALVGVMVFMVAMATTFALKCYVCDDVDHLVENSICGDTFVKDEHKDLLQTCNASAGEVWCRKQKTGVNKVVTRIVRSCAVQCEDDVGAYIDRVDCCNNEDGCNGGSHHTPTLFVLIASAFYAFVKYY